MNNAVANIGEQACVWVYVFFLLGVYLGVGLQNCVGLFSLMYFFSIRVFEILGFELKAYTLSHSTSPFL
jgi:hypothetical protein